MTISFKNLLWLFAIATSIFDFKGIYAQENLHPLESIQTSPIPSGRQEREICGSLELVEGDVQIFDEDRTRLIEIRRKAPLPCGCWIASNQGRIILSHSDGARLNLGSGSYLQLFSRKSNQEQVVIYRGQIYAEVAGNENDFKLGSSLGRVKIQHAKVIYLTGYAKNPSSQLIVLENSAFFENRFEDSKSVRVSEGEVSELKLSLSRVMPQDPTAVAVEALKSKLNQLMIDEKIQSKALNVAMRRGERTLAQAQKKAKEANSSRRELASVASKSNVYGVVSLGDQIQLHKIWVQKMAPGVPGAEGYLFPGTGLADGNVPSVPRLSASEQFEKRKLMGELLKIQGN
jgi:hypothetical protein